MDLPIGFPCQLIQTAVFLSPHPFYSMHLLHKPSIYNLATMQISLFAICCIQLILESDLALLK